MPLGLAASFAPNLSSSAVSTAFFTSRVFAQRNAGVFLSAVMAAPMFAHPVTADELTYSATALESASGVMLNPVGVVREEENQMGNASRDRLWADQLHIRDRTGPDQRAASGSREI